MKPVDIDVLPSSQAAVLAAVIILHESTTMPLTVRDVGAFCGLRSPATTHAHLVALRRRGLVEWDDMKVGTLRPAVAVIPYSPR